MYVNTLCCYSDLFMGHSSKESSQVRKSKIPLSNRTNWFYHHIYHHMEILTRCIPVHSIFAPTSFIRYLQPILTYLENSNGTWKATVRRKFFLFTFGKKFNVLNTSKIFQSVYIAAVIRCYDYFSLYTKLFCNEFLPCVCCGICKLDRAKLNN